MSKTAPIRDLDLRRAGELQPVQLHQVAALVRLAMPHFYRTIEHDRADDIIAAQLIEPDNELSQCLCSLSEGAVDGIICAYPAQDQAMLQRGGLHQFAGALERDELARFFANLQALREQVDPVEPRGRYLARIAVAEGSRGTGLADALIEGLFEAAGQGGVSLHVAATNDRAISFYRRHGFTFVDGEGKEYRVMERR